MAEITGYSILTPGQSIKVHVLGEKPRVLTKHKFNQAVKDGEFSGGPIQALAVMELAKSSGAVLDRHWG